MLWRLDLDPDSHSSRDSHDNRHRGGIGTKAACMTLLFCALIIPTVEVARGYVMQKVGRMSLCRTFFS